MTEELRLQLLELGNQLDALLSNEDPDEDDYTKAAEDLLPRIADAIRKLRTP